MGGLQFLGWGPDTYAAANIFDQLANIAAGLGGKRLPDSHRYPRPEKPPEQAVLVAPTLAEINIDALMARFNS